MDILVYLTLAMKVAQAAEAIAPIAEQAYAAITKDGGPTQADFDALHAIDAVNRKTLDSDPA